MSAWACGDRQEVLVWENKTVFSPCSQGEKVWFLLPVASPIGERVNRVSNQHPYDVPSFTFASALWKINFLSYAGYLFLWMLMSKWRLPRPLIMLPSRAHLCTAVWPLAWFIVLLYWSVVNHFWVSIFPMKWVGEFRTCSGQLRIQFQLFMQFNVPESHLGNSLTIYRFLGWILQRLL